MITARHIPIKSNMSFNHTRSLSHSAKRRQGVVLVSTVTNRHPREHNLKSFYHIQINFIILAGIIGYTMKNNKILATQNINGFGDLFHATSASGKYDQLAIISHPLKKVTVC